MRKHPCKLGPQGAPCKKTATCRLCYLFHHDERYNRHWGGDGIVAPGIWQQTKNFASAVVRHAANGFRHVTEEEKQRRLAICQTCNLFADGRCHHKDCGCRLQVKASWELERCPAGKWEPPPEPSIRHLLYHIMPMRGNGVWQRNLDQLKQRWDLFNGHKIVAVVRSTLCDPPKMVQEYLNAPEVEWIVKRNVPHLREVETWADLWGRLADVRGPNDLTFYAHAKGVTRPVNPGVTVHLWARLLYTTCLDYWPLAGALLQKCPIAGSFRKVGHGFGGSRSRWHYSGSFFWVRNDVVFTRELWQTIDRQWWGTEAWPGLHFHPDEAGCIFHSGRVPGLDLYSMTYLKNVVEPAFEQWQRDHHQHLSAVATASSTPTSRGA